MCAQRCVQSVYHKFHLQIPGLRFTLANCEARMAVAGFWAVGYLATLPLALFSKPIKYHYSNYRDYCGYFCEVNLRPDCLFVGLYLCMSGL